MPFSEAQRRLVAAASCAPASVASSASTEATISGRSSIVAVLIRIATQQHYRGVRQRRSAFAPWLEAGGWSPAMEPSCLSGQLPRTGSMQDLDVPVRSVHADP